MNQYKNELLNKYWENWDNNGLICKPNGKLYHYTSAEAIISILNKNEFWLTNSNFMNDNSETTYACKLFNDRLDQSKINEKNKIVLKEMVDLAVGKGLVQNNFILSFSMNSDSLPMWQYYGGKAGYILGKSPKFIKDFGDFEWIYSIKHSRDDNGNHIKVKNPHKQCVEVVEARSPMSYSVVSNNVIYDKKIQISIMDTIIAHIEERLIENAYTLGRLIDFIPFIKHESYTNEEEYRIIISFDKTQMNRVQHNREREGAIIPFVKLKFNKREYIQGIGISPNIFNEYTKLGVENIIRNYPSKLEFIESQIPSRF